MKFGKDSDQWPRDSLRRTLLLNYPGCKSVTEALELARKPSSSNQRPPELTKEYESMRKAIIDIANVLDGYNIDLLDPRLREELARMPLKSLEDVEAWKQSWLGIIENRITLRGASSEK
jgi:hypothetical protein